MSCEVVIRSARAGDLEQRLELVRRGFSACFWDAFLFFFFQELTLECCVLAGAVLFIFCGAAPGALLLLPPGAAGAVAALVGAAHGARAQRHAQAVRGELCGLVAEARGPGGGSGQVVGTVSVSAFWGAYDRGWLHALAVHPDWRARGVGRALAGAARAQGARRGLAALEACASALQPGARAALAAAGWQPRGAYERPLLGAALTLPLLRLCADLPLAGRAADLPLAGRAADLPLAGRAADLPLAGRAADLPLAGRDEFEPKRQGTRTDGFHFDCTEY